MFLLKDMSGRDAVATVNTSHVLKHFGGDKVTVQAWVKNAKVGEALEEVHWVETLLMDYIKANYSK